MLNTIGAFLLVSLASPIYDLARLRAAQSTEGGPGLQWNRRYILEPYPRWCGTAALDAVLDSGHHPAGG